MPENSGHRDGGDGIGDGVIATDTNPDNLAQNDSKSFRDNGCAVVDRRNTASPDAVSDTVSPHPGYGRHDGRHVRAHIHFYEREHGPVPEGMELDHTCRNRACVNPDHLEAVTHLENCRRGRLVKTGMTIEKAREARQMRAGGASYADISERMGIGKSLVAQIVTNRCWKDESPPRAPRPALPRSGRGGQQ